MNKIADEPRQLYKISSAEEADLNNKTATDTLTPYMNVRRGLKN